MLRVPRLLDISVCPEVELPFETTVVRGRFNGVARLSEADYMIFVIIHPAFSRMKRKRLLRQPAEVTPQHVQNRIHVFRTEWALDFVFHVMAPVGKKRPN